MPNVSTFSIATSKIHWFSPFSEAGSFTLSTREKACAIALAIFTGIIGIGIGGVLSFYLLTAYFKSRRIQQQKTAPKPAGPVLSNALPNALSKAPVPPAPNSPPSPPSAPSLHVYTTGLGESSVRERC